jgi:uncharacterized tellurite resistance protein B-like protein
METRDKLSICKVVAQAILSDAAVTDEERDFLFKLMDRYELDPSQRKDCLARNLGDDPAALVADMTGDPEARKELLRELARAVAADGTFAEGEEGLIRRVGEVMGVPADDIEGLVGDAIE